MANDTKNGRFMKKPKPDAQTRKRNTLAKQIESAPDIKSGKYIAKHGANPSKAEMDVVGYLESGNNQKLTDIWTEMMSNLFPENAMFKIDVTKQLRQWFSEELLACISDRDAESIKKLLLQ